MSVALALRPKFRHTETFLLRVLSGLVLVPLSLCIIYMGTPYSLVFGWIVAAGLLIEWIFLCVKSLLPLLSKITVILVGTAYLIVAILWLLHLFTQPEGWRILFWLLFLVWSTDTAAYLGGRLLGGPKLAPSISPQKTWSGFCVGMIGGISIAYILSFWILPHVFNLWEIICLVLIAQIGDLLESKVKRWSHVKDSGFLIPGHGGLLDRLDSLIAVSFSIAVWQWFRIL